MQPGTPRARIIIVALSLSLSIGLGGCPGILGGGAGGVPAFNLPPTPTITTDVLRGVAPLTVQFNSDRSSDDGLIVSRVWDFGDGNTSPEIAPRHTYTTTGDFTVSLTLTDELGLASSRSVVISVTEAPVPVIAVEPAIADSAPASIAFDGSASFDPDGEIVEFRWDFGDGSREFFETVTHVYASSGTFRAKLTVTDDTGITASSEKLIQVGIPTPTIEIRVPPPDVSNVVVSTESELWIQAVYDVAPGAAHFVRAGIDRDRDQCEAQAVLYDVATGTAIATTTGHGDRVNDVAFAPDGSTVLTASDDGTVRRHSASSGVLISSYAGSGRITSVAFSPDGLRLVWGQSDGNIVLADVATGAVIRTFAGHTATVNDVAISPDGTQLLSGANDRRALLWNIADGTILRDFDHALGVNAVAFSPSDPALVAAGSEDGTIKLWNTTSGAEFLTLAAHAGPVNDLVFSADGFALLSAGDDNTARAWSPFLGTLVTTYSGHDDDVVSVAISADGTTVFTGSADGTARVWNSVTAEVTQLVQPCESTISSVAVSPDGTHFLTGVAARNDIQLDTDPPNGNDLNITYPQGLVLKNVASLDFEDVPSGEYFLWAEVNTDQTEVPVRTYASANINVTEPFTTTVAADTPAVPLVDDQASVVPPRDEDRQIFDLGPLNRGDRLFVSLLSIPGFGEFYAPENEFSVMILDADQRIFAWYQALEFFDLFTLTSGLTRVILFTPDTRLVVGHTSLHYYVVVDGGVGVHIRVQRETGLLQPRQQRVLVNFDGIGAAAVGGRPPVAIPALDASDFDAGWGPDETTTIKTVIMQRLNNLYAAYNVQFFSSDDGVEVPLPHLIVHVGGSNPVGLLGIADYVDPRNETTTGTAIIYATDIAQMGLGGFFSNPVVTDADVGGAIGTIAAHEIGHLLGLRHTDDATDLMQGGGSADAGDPTIPRTFKTSLVTSSEQVDALPAIGFQDAPLLLQETVGAAP